MYILKLGFERKEWGRWVLFLLNTRQFKNFKKKKKMNYWLEFSLDWYSTTNCYIYSKCFISNNIKSQY